MKRIAMTLLVVGLLFNGSLLKIEDAHARQAEALSAKPVNINQAGLEELQTLHGIGPAIAQRILDYRQEQGRFEKVEDLSRVRGIGVAKLEKMKNQITI